MSEPMTDERFEQIKTDWAPTGEGYDVGGGHFSTTPPPEVQDVLDLIEEVDRLRALTTITDAMVERAALAMAEETEWPTNEALGGNVFTGTRDDEYRSEYVDMARRGLEAALNEEEGKTND